MVMAQADVRPGPSSPSVGQTRVPVFGSLRRGDGLRDGFASGVPAAGHRTRRGRAGPTGVSRFSSGTFALTESERSSPERSGGCGTSTPCECTRPLGAPRTGGAPAPSLGRDTRGWRTPRGDTGPEPHVSRAPRRPARGPHPGGKPKGQRGAERCPVQKRGCLCLGGQGHAFLKKTWRHEA